VTTSADTGITIAQQDRHGDMFRRLIEVGFSGGDVTVLDELLSSDFVEHQAGVQPANAEGVKGLIMYLHQALPDLTCTIEDMVTVGDKVWARVRGRGTHRGLFMGVPPTGNSITLELVDICRFADGKISEHWGFPDRLSLLEQIGAGPRPPQIS
jgi:predicted ester cyclase